MSEDSSFAAPPFKADEALHKLKRDLRDLGLAEREGRFERKGVAIAKAAVADGAIAAGRVKRPSRTSPEWMNKTLRHGADVRDFVADLKKQLALWSDRDD